MRAKMVEQDWVEAVIGLGPNLFYNSPMESCVVVCNRKKAAARKGKVIFIDAVNEVTRERAQSFLTPTHQQRILTAFKSFVDVPGFAKVANLDEIGVNAGNLSIPMYVKRVAASIVTDRNGEAVSLRSAWDQWQTDGHAFWEQMDVLASKLDLPAKAICPLTSLTSESSDEVRSFVRSAIQKATSMFPLSDVGALENGMQAAVNISTKFISSRADSDATSKEGTLGFVTLVSLGRNGGSSWKISNIIVNIKKLVDVGPDVVIAAAGGATAPPWLLPLIGLYVLNKMIRNAEENITDIEATLLRALWLNRNDKHEVRGDLALQMVNTERNRLRLAPITQQQFDEAETRLIQLRCIGKSNGVIQLLERVVVTN